jgi:hypothetical protein
LIIIIDHYYYYFFSFSSLLLFSPLRRPLSPSLIIIKSYPLFPLILTPYFPSSSSSPFRRLVCVGSFCCIPFPSVFLLYYFGYIFSSSRQLSSLKQSTIDIILQHHRTPNLPVGSGRRISVRQCNTNNHTTNIYYHRYNKPPTTSLSKGHSLGFWTRLGTILLLPMDT